MAAIKATDDQVREAYQKHRNVAEAARACGLSQRRYQIRLRQIGVPSAGFNHHTGTKAQFEAHGGQALDLRGGIAHRRNARARAAQAFDQVAHRCSFASLMAAISSGSARMRSLRVCNTVCGSGSSGLNTKVRPSGRVTGGGYNRA